jgi:Dolichyl-phosphate-mannose-protein mannosyltransferase/ChAPs (Chs5p-Arf1p-binding proteins)
MAKVILTSTKLGENANPIAATKQTFLAPLISTELPWMVFRKFTWLQLSLAIVAVVMVGMSFSHGITGDDIVVNEYGKEIIKYITSLGSYEYNFEHPLPKAIDRDYVIQYYGGLFSVICALFNKISPFAEYTTIHIFNALSGVLASYFIAKICQRYFSDGAAILSVWLLFLAPFWLGNAMNNPKDTPFAAAFIAGIYFILKFVEQFPTVTRKDYIYVILCIAACINVRVGGILLIPYFLLFLGASNFWKKYVLGYSINLFSGILHAFGICIVGYLAASLLWPNATQDPINHPLNSLKALTHIPVGLNQLFDGTKTMSAVNAEVGDENLFVSNFPKSYLIKCIAYTTPFAILIGFCIAAPFYFIVSKQKKSYSYLVALLLLFTVLFPIAYIIYKQSNVYHLWRHVLFVFPSMIALCAIGYHYLASFANIKSLKYGVIGMVAILLLEPLYFIVTTFPNTMSYFNSLVGGTEGAYTNYEVDFYYNSVKESSDWFTKNVVSKLGKNDSVILATNAPHILDQYYKNEPRVKIIYVRWQQRNASKYDYSLFHIAMIPQGILRSGSWAQGNNVLYKACVKGKPMCAVVKKPSNKDVEGMEMLKAQNIQGLQLLQEYATTDSKNEIVNSSIASIILNNDSAIKALPYLQQALSADSQSLEVLGLMGDYYAKTKNGNQAIVYYQKVLNLEPNYLKSYIDIGKVQAANGDANTALQTINNATKDLQFAPEAYRTMATIYNNIGNVAEAQKYMLQSQQANEQLQQAMQRR